MRSLEPPSLGQTDIYCGVIPAEVWKLGGALVIELEVDRGTCNVVDVFTNAPLPALRRHLRRHLRRRAIGHVVCCVLAEAAGAYHAEYWRWVERAIIFAVREFKEDRYVDWLAGTLQCEIHADLVHSERAVA
jgi:hypothetical protein